MQKYCLVCFGFTGVQFFFFLQPILSLMLVVALEMHLHSRLNPLNPQWTPSFKSDQSVKSLEIFFGVDMNLEELNSSEVSRINNKEHIQFFPDKLVFKAYFLRSVPDCFFPLTCLLSPIPHSVQAVNRLQQSSRAAGED